MFINLTCRKANGDLYVTSSEVEMDKYNPPLNSAQMRLHMFGIAETYFANGYDVTLTQEQFD